MPWAVRQVGLLCPVARGSRGANAAGGRGWPVPSRGRAAGLRGCCRRSGAGWKGVGLGSAAPRASGLKNVGLAALTLSPRGHTHTRSLCRIWNPGPFADGALPCNLLRAFISGVIKAWLKTRASSCAAFGLTSTRAARLGVGAGEPLPGPHEAPQRRPRGQGEGGRPRGAPGPPGCSAAAGAGWLRPPQRRRLPRLFPLWLFRKAALLTPPNFTFIFERA